MATTTHTMTSAEAHMNPAHQAYHLLQFAFVVAPVVAGLDKFFHLLTDWDMYLSPFAARMLPASISIHQFMYAVGVIEIIAGAIVAFKPRIGAYIVTLWLWAIIINLLMLSGFYDIALRDFGLSLGALALGRLSVEFDRA